MKIDNVFIGIILAGVFILAMGGLALEMTSNYNTELSGNFTTSMNIINETYSLTTEMSDNLNDYGNTSGTTSASELVVGGSFSVLKLAQNSIGIVISMLNSFAIILGIPAFVLAAIITIIIIGIVIAIVNALLGKVI